MNKYEDAFYDQNANASMKLSFFFSLFLVLFLSHSFIIYVYLDQKQKAFNDHIRQTINYKV